MWVVERGASPEIRPTHFQHKNYRILVVVSPPLLPTTVPQHPSALFRRQLRESIHSNHEPLPQDVPPDVALRLTLTPSLNLTSMKVCLLTVFYA